MGLLKEFFERFTGATERSNFLSSSFVCSLPFFSLFFFFSFFFLTHFISRDYRVNTSKLLLEIHLFGNDLQNWNLIFWRIDIWTWNTVRYSPSLTNNFSISHPFSLVSFSVYLVNPCREGKYNPRRKYCDSSQEKKVAMEHSAPFWSFTPRLRISSGHCQLDWK